MGFFHVLFYVSRTHHQFAKQPSLCEDQTWKQDGAGGSGFQQRVGGLGGLRRMPAGAPLVDGGFAQLGGSSGSLRPALYLGRVGGPPTLCDITGSGGLFQTPKYLLHLLPGAGNLSDGRTALRPRLRKEASWLLRVRADTDLSQLSIEEQVCTDSQRSGLAQEGPAESLLQPPGLLENHWAQKAVVSEPILRPAPSQALCKVLGVPQASSSHPCSEGCCCPAGEAGETDSLTP